MKILKKIAILSTVVLMGQIEASGAVRKAVADAMTNIGGGSRSAALNAAAREGIQDSLLNPMSASELRQGWARSRNPEVVELSPNDIAVMPGNPTDRIANFSDKAKFAGLTGVGAGIAGLGFANAANRPAVEQEIQEPVTYSTTPEPYTRPLNDIRNAARNWMSPWPKDSEDTRSIGQKMGHFSAREEDAKIKLAEEEEQARIEQANQSLVNDNDYEVRSMINNERVQALADQAAASSLGQAEDRYYTAMDSLNALKDGNASVADVDYARKALVNAEIGLEQERIKRLNDTLSELGKMSDSKVAFNDVEKDERARLQAIENYQGSWRQKVSDAANNAAYVVTNLGGYGRGGDFGDISNSQAAERAQRLARIGYDKYRQGMDVASTRLQNGRQRLSSSLDSTRTMGSNAWSSAKEYGSVAKQNATDFLGRLKNWWNGSNSPTLPIGNVR